MSKCFVVLLVMVTAMITAAQQASSAQAENAHTGARAEAHSIDPAQAFQHGTEALNQNRLDEAEHNFRQVLEVDPHSGAAYANLGVVYMRRKQWNKALQSLEKAEKLMKPGDGQTVGVRLNIGLAYYRQNEFLKAIPAFESVLHDQPQLTQARYLLGLCYFFDERWADAVNTLEPLWPQASDQFPYLYVLSNAAHRAGRKELDDRATEQLIHLRNGSPEYHLFNGKYYLDRGQYDQAMTEFTTATDANPNFPFLHFYLGYAHLKKQEYTQARDEFLKDAAIEPDMALNYQELGNAYWLMQEDANAEKSYREALKRDPRLVDSMIGLAKIYQRQQKYAAALAEAEVAVKTDSDRPDVHYVRGQALLRLGRTTEAQKELQIASSKEHRADNEKQNAPVPSPELVQDPQ
jgi:tetratricopeptide (TPR) repeat protein